MKTETMTPEFIEKIENLLKDSEDPKLKAYWEERIASASRTRNIFTEQTPEEIDAILEQKIGEHTVEDLIAGDE